MRSYLDVLKAQRGSHRGGASPDPSMTPGEKILIIGPAWVGDMVMAQSLFKLLRQRDPGRRHRRRRPALVRAARRAHAGGPPRHRAGGRPRRARARPRAGALGRALRAEGYDRAIVLPRSFKSALVPFFARIPVRTGFRHRAAQRAAQRRAPARSRRPRPDDQAVSRARPAGRRAAARAAAARAAHRLRPIAPRCSRSSASARGRPSR